MHDGDFQLIRLKASVNIKGEECKSINEAALAWSFFPSAMSRWCTSRFKIEPIDAFLKQQGQCELLIGFNADEEPGKDRTGNFMKNDNVSYKYSLYDDGYTRDHCESILNSFGLHPNLPIYMTRGGCRKCFFRTLAELKAKYIFNPKGFLEDMDFEKQLQDRRKKFYHINMNAGSYESVKAQVDDEISLWGLEAVKAMYKNVKPHQPCGAFCHR